MTTEPDAWVVYSDGGTCVAHDREDADAAEKTGCRVVAMIDADRLERTERELAAWKQAVEEDKRAILPPHGGYWIEHRARELLAANA